MGEGFVEFAAGVRFAVPANYRRLFLRPSTQKREPLFRMTLGEIRRRPTLPGRFQPSTISVLRLNFCVRDGNRWMPPLLSVASTFVSTASPQGFASAFTFVSAFASQLRLRTLKTAQVALAFASALRFRSACLTMARFNFALRHSLAPASRSLAFARFASLQLRFRVFPLLPRSSPRPISIIKLHALRHFHR